MMPLGKTNRLLAFVFLSTSFHFLKVATLFMWIEQLSSSSGILGQSKKRVKFPAVDNKAPARNPTPRVHSNIVLE